MKKYTHIEEIEFDDDGSTSHFLTGAFMEEVDLQSNLWFNEYPENSIKRKNKIPVQNLREVLKFMADHKYSYQEHLEGEILKIGGEHDMNLCQNLTCEWDDNYYK